MSSSPSTSNGGGPKPAVVVPEKATGHHRVLAFLIVCLAKALTLTWRIKWDDRSGMFTGKAGPIIFCTWHNRLALSMAIYHGFVRKKRPAGGLAALISASRDGGLLADVLDNFEVQPVRGSTSRRGRQALLEATTYAERGYHVAITPDGPRGPRYKIQDGILALAQVTGLPIIPVGVRIRGKISTKSWDRFQIPLPFAACTVVMNEPVYVPRDTTDEQREEIRQLLEKRMMDHTID